MRGAHLLVGLQVALDGIIPADAGSTTMLMSYKLSIQDHPRGCGEHK